MELLRRYAFAMAAFVLMVSCLHAQTAAVSLLQGALKESVGYSALSDVSVSGTVHTIAGDTEETGSFSATLKSGGHSRVERNTSSNPITNVQTISNGEVKGAWLDGEGKSHAALIQNLLPGDDWLVPVFTLQRILSDEFVISYVGNVTIDGAAVGHLKAYKSFGDASTKDAAMLMQRASMIDVYINAQTMRIVKISFSQHPDNAPRVDVPVEILYSEYAVFNGINTPTRVAKYLNGVLVEEYSCSSISFNAGVDSSRFAVEN